MGCLSVREFDPTGRLLALADPFEPEVRLVVWTTGDTVATFPHSSLVTDLAYLDDGSRIATASTDGTVTIWSASDPTVMETYSVTSLGLTFNAQGDELATAGNDGVVRVWDNRTGTEMLQLAGHRGQVTSVSFNATGTRLASAGVDGTARIWDVSPEGNREWTTLAGIAEPASVEFSADSSHLATSGSTTDARVVVRDTETWTVRHDMPGASKAALSPDGSAFVTIDPVSGIATVWDMTTGAELLRLPPQGPGSVTDFMSRVVFSPDGRFLITGNAIGSVQIWEASSGRQLETMPGGHFSAVAGLHLDATGASVLSIGEDSRDAAFVWDVSTARRVSQLEPEVGVTAAALSPDGLVGLTGGPDGVTRAWNAQTGEPLDAPLFQESSTVRSISYSADGRRIATASDDGILRLWDAITSDLLLRWAAHEGGATDVAFSGDGRLVASTGADGTTRVYLARVEDLIDLAQARVSRSLTNDECRRYLSVESCRADA